MIIIRVKMLIWPEEWCMCLVLTHNSQIVSYDGRKIILLFQRLGLSLCILIDLNSHDWEKGAAYSQFPTESRYSCLSRTLSRPFPFYSEKNTIVQTKRSWWWRHSNLTMVIFFTAICFFQKHDCSNGWYFKIQQILL